MRNWTVVCHLCLSTYTRFIVSFLLLLVIVNCVSLNQLKYREHLTEVVITRHTWSPSSAYVFFSFCHYPSLYLFWCWDPNKQVNIQKNLARHFFNLHFKKRSFHVPEWNFGGGAYYDFFDIILWRHRTCCLLLHFYLMPIHNFTASWKRFYAQTLARDQIWRDSSTLRKQSLRSKIYELNRNTQTIPRLSEPLTDYYSICQRLRCFLIDLSQVL